MTQNIYDDEDFFREYGRAYPDHALDSRHLASRISGLSSSLFDFNP
jgi:hypothetical protein